MREVHYFVFKSIIGFDIFYFDYCFYVVTIILIDFDGGIVNYHFYNHCSNRLVCKERESNYLFKDVLSLNFTSECLRGGTEGVAAFDGREGRCGGEALSSVVSTRGTKSWRGSEN